MVKKTKPSEPFEELFPKIRYCIEVGAFRQSRHAIDREIEREIGIQDVLFVLKQGYHEYKKTYFDNSWQTWKYAIRGRTLDGLDVRVIIAFDGDVLVIITVMSVFKA